MSKQQPQPLGTASATDLGFPKVEFEDAHGAAAYLQCSSAIGPYEDSMERPGTSYLWLGVADANPLILAKDAAQHGVQTDEKVGWVPYPVPPAVLLHTSMHLNREQVAGLIGRLQHWLDHGDLGT